MSKLKFYILNIMSFFTKKYLLIFSLIIICISVYYFIYYKSPEKCYFEQIGLLNIKKEELNRVPFGEHITKLTVKYVIDSNSISQDRAELFVSEARSILTEYKLADLPNPQSKEVYLKMKTSFDYCRL